jgi:type I restriction enzyme M protein
MGRSQKHINNSGQSRLGGDEKLTLSQLEQYLSKAAWILKGPIGASDFKAYIFPMLFFKRISDVYEEEYLIALEESDGDKEYAALPEFHRFTIPDSCHWNDVRETTSNIGLKIEQCLREIESANQQHLYGIFGDAQWSNKEKLPWLVPEKLAQSE